VHRHWRCRGLVWTLRAPDDRCEWRCGAHEQRISRTSALRMQHDPGLRLESPVHSESEGAQLAMVHKWLGRLAMITSLVGTTLGYVAAWTDVAVPRATAIGLSVVGVLQYWHTVKGYKAIKQAQASVGDERKRLIEIHRASMTNLYYGCCLGPAWFRLPGWLGLIKMGSAPLWAQAAGMLPPFIIMPMALRTSRDKTFF